LFWGVVGTQKVTFGASMESIDLRGVGKKNPHNIIAQSERKGRKLESLKRSSIDFHWGDRLNYWCTKADALQTRCQARKEGKRGVELVNA